ncbi:hypothetical protein SmJEL517_g02627 [Synchytrium microbalum]|uniref:CDC20/Fizzy WD40 domain-containing protein n=1 Tax=Synchytrium microbalum TaxID=1806994 RepID=A0A507C5K4_9FUNG|nr:uncharacterized protein SmJEL517_g02627 [Synchytrium microbalum]TPX34932.1 hypothetical protein SmJEL517_g02627 [Synchytrium microbalum]
MEHTEHPKRHEDFSSPATPRKKRIRYEGTPDDRFIPDRAFGEDLGAKYELYKAPSTPSRGSKRKPEDSPEDVYDNLLRASLFPGSTTPTRSTPTTLLRFSSPRNNGLYSNIPLLPDSTISDKYTATPSMSMEVQRILTTPRKPPRLVAKTPYKVLDAPELQDDFYLNLVDWSSTNILGVGLGTCVYLWNSSTSKVTKLCDLGPSDTVTSVAWSPKGTSIAVGTNRGLVQLWDASRCKKIHESTRHHNRVGTMAWRGASLTSGGRDRCIYHFDTRDTARTATTMNAHKQEVCGLKWNYEDTQLASGGNDNKLMIWDCRSTTPLHKFSEHIAAVKAIAWSPHQHGLLASGGGTADRKIRFQSTLNFTSLNSIDTGSQVCNLAWSKNSNEIVSTHGYSQHQVVIWKYPTMTPVATLTGHTYRVLYLATSPDGQNIVTGAGDETLRFWNVFGKSRPKEIPASPFTQSVPR